MLGNIKYLIRKRGNKMIERRKIVVLILTVCITLQLLGANNVYAKSYKEYKFNNIKQLQNQIEQYYSDKKITAKEMRYLRENTSPEVQAKYFFDIIEQAEEIMKSENLELSYNSLGDLCGQREIELSQGAKVIVTAEDVENRDTVDLLKCKIKNSLVETVFAFSESSSYKNNYGNRYCYYSWYVICGLGEATLTSKTYYTLSSKGISITSGETSASQLSLCGGAESDDFTIICKNSGTSGTAQSSGKFRISASAGFGSGNMGFNYDANYFIYTELKCKSIDKNKNQVSYTINYHS